jgi:hypothetical protein
LAPKRIRSISVIATRRAFFRVAFEPRSSTFSERFHNNNNNNNNLLLHNPLLDLGSLEGIIQPHPLTNTMRFFGRNKKQQTKNGTPDTSSVVVTAPTIQITSATTDANAREEPLLSSPKDIETAASAATTSSKSVANSVSRTTKQPYSLSRPPEATSETPVTPYAKLPPDVSKPVAHQQAWYNKKVGNTKVGLGTALIFLLGLTATVSAITMFLKEEISYNQHRNVAFIGNSNLFVNDLPRLMEAMADGKIFQDSCLHSKGSIMNILKTGNGMYQRWQTNAAALVTSDDNGDANDVNVTWVNDDGETTQLYDYGACSVPQLLIGSDAYLTQGGYEDQDDTNPCLQSEGYLDYTESFNYSQPWDFVILTDQSKRMCYPEAREEALMALNYTYIPILEHNSGIPIIVQPHGFWSESVNMTGLGNVPTFTAKIYQGALEYQQFMETRLPEARLAPVGMAFLVVYDQDKDLWSKLFLSDGIHPSPSGTFLYASVIYATIYGHMPKNSVVLLKDMSRLWSRARKLQSNDFPERAEAEYLMGIARKVTLKGFLPDSLPNMDSTEYAEEEEEEYDYDNEEEDEDTWDGDYDGWYDYSWNGTDNAQYSNNYQDGNYNANANGEYAN